MGLILTFGVACAAVLVGLRPEVKDCVAMHWPRATPNSWPLTPDYGVTLTAFGCSIENWSASRGDLRSEEWEQLYATSGWPLPAFYATISGSGFSGPSFTLWGGVSLRDAGVPGEPPICLPIPEWARSERTILEGLPFRPLWLGLAADVLIYALTSVFIVTAITRYGRRRRIAKHLCGACGHPRVSQLCPECGTSGPSNERCS